MLGYTLTGEGRGLTAASDRDTAERFATPPALDRLAAELEELRIARESVSYSDLAARITQRRENTGLSPAAARIARSTVYDAFRLGRSRIRPGLIAEIVLALTNDELEAERWRQRAVRAMAKTRVLRPVARISTTVATHPVALKPGAALAVLIVVACFGLNNLGGQFVADFGVPLYLDMVGTAIAAVTLGPWYGVAAGLTNNVLGSLLDGNLPSLWFALINVLGALIWGYGVRAWRLGRSPLRYLFLNLIVAIACSLAAVPILVFIFGGSTGHPGQDAMTPALAALGAGLWGAVFSSNILISVVDKLISGYAALFAVFLLDRYGMLRPAFDSGWLLPRGTPVAFAEQDGWPGNPDR